jgi:chromosome segregation ATPase
VGQLQAELSATRLQEFEAQEQAMSLTAELEEEKTRRARAETELHELRMMKDNLGRVSRLVATEMTALREQCQHEKEEAHRMKLEADEVMYGCRSIKHSAHTLHIVQAYLSTQLGDQVTPNHL